MRDPREDQVSASVTAAALVPFLPGWTVKLYPGHDEGTDERMMRHCARLAREDGAEIGLSIQTYPKLRLRIRGDFPRLEGRIFGRYDKAPHMTVDPFKAPERIAADISRRLLPEYLPLYAEGRAELEAHQGRLDQSEQLGAQLAGVLGCTWRTREPHLRRDAERLYVDTIEHTGCGVTIQREYGNEARFDLSLPGPLALKLAAWISRHLQHPTPEEVAAL